MQSADELDQSSVAEQQLEAGLEELRKYIRPPKDDSPNVSDDEDQQQPPAVGEYPRVKDVLKPPPIRTNPMANIPEINEDTDTNSDSSHLDLTSAQNQEPKPILQTDDSNYWSPYRNLHDNHDPYLDAADADLDDNDITYWELKRRLWDYLYNLKK